MRLAQLQTIHRGGLCPENTLLL